MANVKSRNKSQKSSKKTYVRKGKKSPEPEQPKQALERDIVMRRGSTSTSTTMTTSERVAMLLKHGHLLRDQFVKKTKKVNKNTIDIRKETILDGEGGIIKNKSKEKFIMLDNILKQELMIVDSMNLSKSSKKVNHNNNICTSPEKNNNDQSTGASSLPELDDNSNKIKKDKTKRSKQNRLSKNANKSFKQGASNTNGSKPTKRKQVTLSNGVVLTLSLFFCDYCEKGFSNKSTLRRHIFIHLNLKPHGCTYCSKRFRQRTNLKAHIIKKHYKSSTKPHVCPYCSKPFQSKENFELHINNHIKKDSFQCVFCEKKFGQQLALMEHEKRHLVSGRFLCSICKMSYDCRSRLALHVKSHLNIKEYVCPYCGKEFLRPNSIRRHIEISHDGFRIQCPICNKKLKGHLTEHLRMHEKKRPHQCPDCGMCFTQSTQLTVHRRGHTGARPYACRICQQRFTHSNALMLHTRRHTGEKPFPCAMCPMFFSQLPHMKSHMKKIHGKEEPYKCPKCDDFFKLKADVEAHGKTCTAGQKELSFEERIQAAAVGGFGEPEVESVMSISRMRFLLALLLTMIASKEKLKYLGFNKRLIDDLLLESLEAMGKEPVRDQALSPLMRLKTNIRTLLEGTVPPDQMEKFKRENKSTEELLELLTGEKK